MGTKANLLTEMIGFVANRMMRLPERDVAGRGSWPTRRGGHCIAEDDVLAHMSFPKEHWAQIHSTNRWSQRRDQTPHRRYGERP